MAADNGFTADPHSERGNACPRNRFGITDYEKLQMVEGPLVINRAGELRDRGITGRFDSAHLRSIHKYLFQDVFPWAGEFRVVNISKGSSNFGMAQHIVSALADALDKLGRESFLTNLAPQAFANRAAFYLGEINAIPFASAMDVPSASSSASLLSMRVIRSSGRSGGQGSPKPR